MLSKRGVLKWILVMFKFDLGWIAFGSFIVALIKNNYNAILTYIQRKVGQKKNAIGVCLFSCVICVLKCLKCCIHKLNKNAFIFIVVYVYGTPFYYSCTQVFSTLFHNLARVTLILYCINIFIIYKRRFIK